MQPELIKALVSLGDKELMIKVATALKTIPMGIDEGMGDVLGRLFKDTVVESTLRGSHAGNGSAVPTRA
jgi:hypothetical protein